MYIILPPLYFVDRRRKRWQRDLRSKKVPLLICMANATSTDLAGAAIAHVIGIKDLIEMADVFERNSVMVEI